MKIKSLIILFVFFSGILLSQNDKRSEAFNKYSEGDFNSAKLLIDECCINPETKDHPKTWYFKAIIYLELAKAKGNSDDNYAEQSYKAVLKSRELDDKGLFIQENTNCLLTLSTIFLNQGSNAYNSAINQDSKDLFLKAENNFNHFFDVMKSLGNDSTQVVDFLNKNNMPYNDILVFAGYSAYKAENIEKAKKYYKQLVEKPQEELINDKTGYPFAFITYCNILIDGNNITEAKAVIEKALSVWPENKDIALTELKIYQKAGDIDVLMQKYEKAVINDPQNVNLLATLANKYDNIYRNYYIAGDEINAEKYRAEADETYQRAIKLYDKDDEFKYNLYYNNALLYYNPAVDLYHKSLDIPQEKRGELEKQFMPMFEKSAILFEKAFNINNKDKKLIDMMVRIYLILGNEDRSKELQEHYMSLE